MKGSSTEWRDRALRDDAADLILAEAREVLNGQITRIGQIEREALWKVRTSAIILGLVITFSAGSILLESEGRFVVPIVALGTIASVVLAIALIMASRASRATRLLLGIEPSDMRYVHQRGTRERELREFLVTEYISWIVENQRTKRRIDFRLLVSDWTLYLGILLTIVVLLLAIMNEPILIAREG